MHDRFQWPGSWAARVAVKPARPLTRSTPTAATARNVCTLNVTTAALEKDQESVARVQADCSGMAYIRVSGKSLYTIISRLAYRRDPSRHRGDTTHEGPFVRRRVP